MAYYAKNPLAGQQIVPMMCLKTLVSKISHK